MSKNETKTESVSLVFWGEDNNTAEEDKLCNLWDEDVDK